MDRKIKINIICLIILVGFVISVIYHYVYGVYLSMPYPFNTFLFIPSDRFMDFFNVIRVSGSPYSSDMIIPYFPLTMIIAEVFNAMANKNISLIIFLTIFISFFTYACFNAIKTKKSIGEVRNLFIFLFLTYPVLFSIDRGNFEILVFIFLYLFVIFYNKGKSLLSIIFLILAISMKLFPALFLLVFLKDKKYKEASFVVFFSVIIMIICYSVLPGGLINNINGHLKNLNLFNQAYAIGDGGLQMGHSLWGVLKVFIKGIEHFFNNSWATNNLSSLFKYYIYFAGLVFALLSLYVYFIEKIFWKTAFILIASFCVLPHVSSDYKLIHLFIPLFLFINHNYPLSNKTNKKSIIKSSDILEKKHGFDLFYVIIFGLLLIPKDYYIFFKDVSISVILTPFLMILMTIVIITEGFIDNNNLRKKYLSLKI